MGEWTEELKNAIGTIFIILGSILMIASTLLLGISKDIYYLSLLANGATFIGLGFVINESSKTRQKMTAKEFELRDYAIAVWDFFEPRCLIDGTFLEYTTRYNDRKKIFEVANDARHFLLGPVKKIVKEAISEMEINLELKNEGKFKITFKEKMNEND